MADEKPSDESDRHKGALVRVETAPTPERIPSRELREARAHATVLAGQIARFEAERHAILGSFSWRVTKPLRALSGRLKLFAKSLKRAEVAAPLKPSIVRASVKDDLRPGARLVDVDWYLQRYLPSTPLGVDARTHYQNIGAPAGYWPNPYFNPRWYVERHSDLKLTIESAADHYVLTGAKQGREPNADFDCAWYLVKYPDVARSGLEPFEHFLKIGARAGRKPNSGRKPTALELGTSPEDSRRYISDLLEGSRGSNNAVYVPFDEDTLIMRTDDDPKIIAFYLPQFHPTPENDRWWGRGFTEWSNVTRAVPHFVGHQQPQLPIDLGFYDLRTPDVLPRQAQLARHYGISGFMFYYYWFSGKRLLEAPINQFLSNKDIDLEFSLCWANENWTRRWDGRDQEVLISQHHSPEDDREVIKDIARHFDDQRYIRVDGKPMLTVYRFPLMPEPEVTIERWREYCWQSRREEIFVVEARTTYGEEFKPTNGIDASMEFPPHCVPREECSDVVKVNPKFSGRVYDYTAVANEAPEYARHEGLVFRTVFPSWDNTARRGEHGTVFHKASPELYKEWLKRSLTLTRRNNPKHAQIVFVNAWNEWAEGAHLEPDRRLGYSNLRATAEAVIESRHEVKGIFEWTQSKQRVIFAQRWKEVEELFADEVNRAQYRFLVEYTGLLRSFAELRREQRPLFIESGVPIAIVNGAATPLRSKEDLAVVSSAVTASRSKGPFCFVVLQYNKPELTVRCVESIKKLDRAGEDICVVVVDNGSSQENVTYTWDSFAGDPAVKLIFNKENCGFAKGNNVGYEYSRNDLGASFVVIINNDVVIEQADFIERTLRLYQTWSFSLLGPDVEVPHGLRRNPYNDSVFSLEDWRGLLSTYRKQYERFVATGRATFDVPTTSTPSAPIILNPLLQGALLIASPLYVHRHERIFDPSTFLYGEEFLLSINALLEGDLTLYASELKVQHEESSSTDQLEPAKKAAIGYENAILAIEIAAARLGLANSRALRVNAWVDKGAVKHCLKNEQNNILVDLFFCQWGHHAPHAAHGGGEYGKAVFRDLVSQTTGDSSTQLWAAVDENLTLDDWVWDICRSAGVNLVRVKSYSDIADLVNQGIFDSFFAPAVVVYTGYEYMKRIGGQVLFSASRTRVIGSLLDLRDLELAQDPSSKKALTDMYRRLCGSPAITELVTISEYSRSKILELAGDIRLGVEVCYPPLKPQLVPVKATVEGCDVENEPFALVLNANRPEKNAAAIVKAFDQLFSSPDSAQKLPAGLKVLLVSVSSLKEIGVVEVRNRDRFVLTSKLSPEALEYLYSKARALVYASLNEGFGLPPLEAMRHGTPSLVSNCTAIPEVCGAAVVYCDPHSAESIRDGIVKVFSEGVESELMQKQLSRLALKQHAQMQNLIKLICDGRGAPVEGAAPQRVHACSQ